MIDKDGRLILDHGLSTGATGGSSTTGTGISHGYGDIDFGGGYTSSGDWIFYLIMLLVAVGACVFAYLAYGDLKAVDGGGFETAITTWGAIVMIPVLVIVGYLFLDTSVVSILWTIAGVLIHGYLVFFGDQPEYHMMSVYCLISSICATVILGWLYSVDVLD